MPEGEISLGTGFQNRCFRLKDGGTENCPGANQEMPAVAMHLAIIVGKFIKQDAREWYPSTTGPQLPTMTDSGYLVLRDVLPEFHNIVTLTDRRVQRTLLFGRYFLRILLFAGHGGGGIMSAWSTVCSDGTTHTCAVQWRDERAVYCANCRVCGVGSGYPHWGPNWNPINWAPGLGTELIEYRTACPTNTPVRTVFFEVFIVRWTRGRGVTQHQKRNDGPAFPDPMHRRMKRDVRHGL